MYVTIKDNLIAYRTTIDDQVKNIKWHERVCRKYLQTISRSNGPSPNQINKQANRKITTKLNESSI